MNFNDQQQSYDPSHPLEVLVRLTIELRGLNLIEPLCNPITSWGLWRYRLMRGKLHKSLSEVKEGRRTESGVFQ